MTNRQKIGFTCAYTPLPLIDAAGFAPYRILPVGDVPDQAGHLLHDNLCPNIKRILDRALSDDLPELAGTIFINSCDAMRRMSDAWAQVRKNDRTVLLDLPTTSDDLSISFFKNELVRVSETLGDWRGKKINTADMNRSIEKFNKISRMLLKTSDRFHKKQLTGGNHFLQSIYNLAATSSFDETLARLQKLEALPDSDGIENDGIPVYLFGNVLCDPEAFAMIEACGAVVVNDDFCTGSRMFSPMGDKNVADVYQRMAHALMTKTPCARTFDPAQPGKIAEDVLIAARASHACGIIGHTVKFCDPYLERLPGIRETLRNSGIPFLLLEGDCTLRSMGQQKTRIEAFIEMLR